MNEIKEKLRKVQRILAIDQNRLKIIIGELAVIESSLKWQQEQLGELQMLQSQDLQVNLGSVETLTQTRIWLDSIEEAIRAVIQQIESTQRSRDESYQRMLEQRARVRGLEILADQLQLQIGMDVESQQSRFADEVALKDFARS